MKMKFNKKIMAAFALAAMLLAMTAGAAMAEDIGFLNDWLKVGGGNLGRNPNSGDRWMINPQDDLMVKSNDFEIGSIDITGTSYSVNIQMSFDLCGPISSDADYVGFYGEKTSILALSGDAKDLEFLIHAGTLTFSMPLSNDSIKGGIVKSGDGSLGLGDKVNMADLSIDIKEGTLYVNTEASAGKVTAWDGTTLAGYGTVARLVVSGEVNVDATQRGKPFTLSNIAFASQGSALTANSLGSSMLIVDGIDAQNAGEPILYVDGRAESDEVCLEAFAGDVYVRTGRLVVSHDRDYGKVSLDVAAGGTLDMRIAIKDQASSLSTPVQFKRFTAEPGFTVVLSADDELIVDKWYSFVQFDRDGDNTVNLTSADIAFVVDEKARSADVVYSSAASCYQVKLLPTPDEPSIEELLEKVGANSKDLKAGWNIIWFDPELDGADAAANPKDGFRIKSGDKLTFEVYFLKEENGSLVFDDSYDNRIISADMFGGLYTGGKKAGQEWDGTDTPVATNGQVVLKSHAEFEFDEKNFSAASGIRGATEEYTTSKYHFAVYNDAKTLLADPANLTFYAERETGGSGGSGVGCDAGFAAFGLLALVPMMARRRK